jgi:hypothetical protein
MDLNGKPDTWNANGKLEQIALDNAVRHTGEHSVRIDAKDENGRTNIAFGRSITAGYWRFEAACRTEGKAINLKHSASASLRVVDAEGVQLHTMTCFAEHTDGQWGLLQRRFEVREPAVRISVVLKQFAGEGHVWWDDVSLRYDTAAAADAAAAAEADRAATPQAEALLAELRPAFEALPEDTVDAKLKRAALAWAVEDAQASLDAGLGADALAVLTETRAALERPLAKRVHPTFPEIEAFDDNPYVQGVLEAAEACAKNTRTYTKGPEGYDEFKSGWELSGVADRSLVSVWALCQPNSPMAGDPRLLTFALRNLQALFQSHTHGDLNPYRALSHGYHDPNINRFAYRPGLEAYLLLRSTYPDLILPCKLSAWDASVREVLDYQLDTYGNAKPRQEDIRYPNMDVMYMLLMALGGRLLERPELVQEGQRFLKGLEGCLYPDGAFTYTGHQNECFSYHQINVAVIARYWQVTGDDLAREIVARTRPYYPLSVEPGGVPEYYTDPFWKHYWGGPAPSEAPEIVAGITGCPYNKRIANQSLAFRQPRGQYAIYAASFWRDFPDKPLPDNYVLYDRNVQGPRGRYGRFSFGGTTRDYGWGYQGKDTFVGCMALDEPTVAYPLNAALQVVTNQVRVALDGQRWRTCKYLSMDEKNAVTVGGDLAALTTRYRIQNVAWGGRSTLTAWAGNQQWLMTPGRLVGLLEIEPLEDRDAYAIHGRIRFGVGRSKSVGEKEIERKDDRFFKYGALMCRLHEHNYADVITEESETFYIDKPEAFRSREIVLRDPRSVAEDGRTKVHYPAGTRQYFTVEVFPYWSDLAESVVRVATDSGLRGIEVTEKDRVLLLVHNPTDSDVRYRADHAWAAGTAALHRSGTTEPHPESVALDGSVDVLIPAQTHIVIEKKR